MSHNFWFKVIGCVAWCDIAVPHDSSLHFCLCLPLLILKYLNHLNCHYRIPSLPPITTFISPMLIAQTEGMLYYLVQRERDTWTAADKKGYMASFVLFALFFWVTISLDLFLSLNVLVLLISPSLPHFLCPAASWCVNPVGVGSFCCFS